MRNIKCRRKNNDRVDDDADSDQQGSNQEAE